MAKNFINKVNYPATEKEVVNGGLTMQFVGGDV